MTKSQCRHCLTVSTLISLLDGNRGGIGRPIITIVNLADKFQSSSDTLLIWSPSVASRCVTHPANAAAVDYKNLRLTPDDRLCLASRQNHTAGLMKDAGGLNRHRKQCFCRPNCHRTKHTSVDSMRGTLHDIFVVPAQSPRRDTSVHSSS